MKIKEKLIKFVEKAICKHKMKLIVSGLNDLTGPSWVTIEPESKITSVDTRIMKKPIDLVKNITEERPVVDLTNLNEKVKIVKERIKALDKLDINCYDEQQALSYLEARQKYLKIKSKVDFGYVTTNTELITKLCEEYSVMLVDFKSYYKNVPTEALNLLNDYLKKYDLVSPKTEPSIKLIIDDVKEKKKDPILLAASPFGNWYFIIGAWDKEIEIVDDLIYKGK